MIVWVFIYISMSLQKLSDGSVVFKLFVLVNNELFGFEKVTFFLFR